MSKKEIFTKDLVTPDEVLSNYFQIGTLVYFKDGSFVVLCAQKKQMTCFR